MNQKLLDWRVGEYINKQSCQISWQLFCCFLGLTSTSFGFVLWFGVEMEVKPQATFLSTHVSRGQLSAILETYLKEASLLFDLVVCFNNGGPQLQQIIKPHCLIKFETPLFNQDNRFHKHWFAWYEVDLIQLLLKYSSTELPGGHFQKCLIKHQITIVH